jgi:hypothetical protein
MKHFGTSKNFDANRSSCSDSIHIRERVHVSDEAKTRIWLNSLRFLYVA